MIEWWRSLWSRKGGAHKDRRLIMILLVILIIIIVWGVPRKMRYTENWEKTNMNSYRLDKLETYHRGE